MRLARLVETHQRIGIDSNVLIYLFEGSGREADAAAALIDAIEDGQVEAVLATIGLTEILTRPASMGDGATFERYVDELRGLPNLQLIVLGDEVAIDAAWGRAGDRDLGDAIHVASSRHAGATAFVTNDRRIRGRAGVEVIHLDGLTA